MFDIVEERISDPALDLSYHLAPWDQPIFAANTAHIARIEMLHPAAADRPFGVFQTWCRANQVVLVDVRLAQERLAECGFLEARGFRFIELNYRPVTTRLDRFQADAEITVAPATIADREAIMAIAAQTIVVGRLHADPMVGPEIGNRRYGAWAGNAFAHPGQQVLKYLIGGQMVAFSVIERPAPDACFISLAALAPGLPGGGLGRRMWMTMLAHCHREGITTCTTSISSHNAAVLNLHVALGFRFPSPSITLHWCPDGPVRTA